MPVRNLSVSGAEFSTTFQDGNSFQQDSYARKNHRIVVLDGQQQEIAVRVKANLGLD